MPRRKDSFAAALADAQKRLAKAKTERADATSRLVELDAEIPRLEQVIASLDPERVKEVRDDMLHGSAIAVGSGIRVPADNDIQREVPALTPDQVKKLAERATGPIRGGSIPYGGVKPPAPPVSEEEMLPNPEGEEIID